MDAGMISIVLPVRLLEGKDKTQSQVSGILRLFVGFNFTGPFGATLPYMYWISTISLALSMVSQQCPGHTGATFHYVYLSN